MALTEEDKVWLSSRMDARFDKIDAYLRPLEARLDKIEARLDKVEARLNTITIDMKEYEHRTNESLERLETRLLTEFHKWASPMDARIRSHAAVVKVLDLEANFPCLP